jgi:hypothetical protein
MYGSMVVNGKKFVWDYVADVAVSEAEMPVGSERWKASEKAKWEPVERLAVTSKAAP